MGNIMMERFDQVYGYRGKLYSNWINKKLIILVFVLKKLEGNTVATLTRKGVFFDKMEAIKLEV